MTSSLKNEEKLKVMTGHFFPLEEVKYFFPYAKLGQILQGWKVERGGEDKNFFRPFSQGANTPGSQEEEREERSNKKGRKRRGKWEGGGRGEVPVVI